MRRIFILSALIVALALAHEAWAMSYGQYQLNWYVPLTGSGMAANSSHYALNMTVGQSIIGQGRADYVAGLGFWYGIRQMRMYLPIVNRS